MSLLERDAQLRRLEAALDRARQGQGATVLVSGEAGIGKTSLLEYAASVASGARLLRATGSGLVDTISRSSLTTSGASSAIMASDPGAVPTSSRAITQPRARMSATRPRSAAGRS